MSLLGLSCGASGSSEPTSVAMRDMEASSSCGGAGGGGIVSGASLTFSFSFAFARALAFFFLFFSRFFTAAADSGC